jgi:uncharacterized protein (DUF697 family)
MNKKKLPRVIRPATDRTGDVAAGFGESAARATPAGAAPDRLIDSEAAPPGGGIAARSLPSPPVAGVPARATPTAAKGDAARRRMRARSIVERHAAYSAVGGIIPLPIVNVASITAVIVRMVKALSDVYHVPFERDRTRAIVVGLMGGAMPTGLAAAATSTLVYIVPGSNLIGLAVSSMTALACTRGIGNIFIEHFESGATLHDFSAAQRI